ncbi:MAG: thioesterase, partial [Bacteroidia bacterium]|nr:thioesterase [Bacteroidia bacterium]
MKLFCFPYAGGSSVVFNNWKSYLRYDIELRAIELAGRGKRIMDAHY